MEGSWKLEPSAAARAKDVVQVTLTGTANKIRKKEVSSPLLQLSVVSWWQNLSGGQLVKDGLAVSQLSITKQSI